MSLKADINFLPDFAYPGNFPAGPVIATGGGGSVTLSNVPSGMQGGADGARMYLKQLTAVKVGSGTSQPVNFILSADLSNTPTLYLPVGPSAEGTRIVWEFPVPPKDRIAIFIEVPAGGGNWAFVANGFVI